MKDVKPVTMETHYQNITSQDKQPNFVV